MPPWYWEGYVVSLSNVWQLDQIAKYLHRLPLPLGAFERNVFGKGNITIWYFNGSLLFNFHRKRRTSPTASPQCLERGAKCVRPLRQQFLTEIVPKEIPRIGWSILGSVGP